MGAKKLNIGIFLITPKIIVIVAKKIIITSVIFLIFLLFFKKIFKTNNINKIGKSIKIIGLYLNA